MTEPHANPEDFDLYALGVLDGADKQGFEVHVNTCPICRQELAAAQARTALLGLAATPVTPRTEVKSALMEKIKAERATNAQPTVPTTPKNIRWGLRFSLGFGLATVVLAIATFELAKTDLNRGKQIKQLQAQVAEDKAAIQATGQVAGAPDTAVVTLFQQAGGPAGQAHVLYNARLGIAVYSGQLAPAPADKNYQLWLVPAAGSPVSAGLVSANQENGAVVVHLTPGIAAKAFAVTLEPQSGSSQPTGPKVLIGTANS